MTLPKPRSWRIKKHDSFKAINVNEDTWMYANERRGLCVVRRVRAPGGALVLATETFHLPWSKVQTAIDCRPPPRPAKKKAGKP